MRYLPWRNRRFVLDRGLPETEVVKWQTVLSQLSPRCLLNFRAAVQFGTSVVYFDSTIWFTVSPDLDFLLEP